MIKAPEVEIALQKTEVGDAAFGLDSTMPGENNRSEVSLALGPQLQLDSNMNKPLPNNNDTRAKAVVIYSTCSSMIKN